jgi:TetR/AcrR family transcriptional regulator
MTTRSRPGARRRAVETAPLPRREREKLRQRDELLAAAMELFSEKGFHNVSMHEIAQKAEFAVGTLYRFFKDKEDLYKALIRSRAERFHATLKEILAGADREDVLGVLKKYVEAKTALLTGGAAMLRLYFAETRGASFNIRSGLDREILALYDDLLASLAAVFEAGVRKKIFRPLNPYYMALSLESLTNGFLQCWIEDPERHPYEANVPLILDIFCRGVLRK